MSRIRIVYYLNQFFGGIGGEDKADAGVSVLERPVGPAIGLAQAMDDAASVVATIICGDNFFQSRHEEATTLVRDAILRFAPDVVVAGPAFNAGRYGLACGEVCQLAARNGIPAVTGMYSQNPAVLRYRRNVFILKTGDSAAYMKEALPRLASFALRLARREEIGSAETEGYVPRGVRQVVLADKPAARRATEMLRAKLEGKVFRTEIPLETFSVVKPAPPVLDLRSATIALVTTSGLVPKGNPDGLRHMNESRWVKYPLSDASSLSSECYEPIHSGYDASFARQNPHFLLPLDAARDLEREGSIGRLHPYYYMTVGVGTPVEVCERLGKEIAADLHAQHVSAAVLTSNWATCSRCGATMTKAIEETGIPVALITALTTLAEDVGAMRIVQGVRIPHPCGNPVLPPDRDRELRKRILKTALAALQTEVSKPTVHVDPGVLM